MKYDDDYMCQVCGEVKTEEAIWMPIPNKNFEGNVCFSCLSTRVFVNGRPQLERLQEVSRAMGMNGMVTNAVVKVSNQLDADNR